MSQIPELFVNGKWHVSDESKRVMIIEKHAAKLLKPTISVQCANLYPDAHYQLAIDFAMIKDDGSFDWKHKRWNFNRILLESSDSGVNGMKLRFHQSGIQPGGFFMGEEIHFDQIMLSVEEVDERTVRVNERAEYVPIIELYCYGATPDQPPVILYFPFIQASFVVARPRTCNNERGKRIARKRMTSTFKLRVFNDAALNHANRPASLSMLDLNRILLALMVNEYREHALVRNPPRTSFSYRSRFEQYVRGLNLKDTLMRLQNAANAGISNDFLPQLTPAVSNIPANLTGLIPQPNGWNNLSQQDLQQLQQAVRSVNVSPDFTVPEAQNILELVRNANLNQCLYLAMGAAKDIYNRLIHNGPASVNQSISLLQRALRFDTVVDEQTVAVELLIALRQSNASELTNANVSYWRWFEDYIKLIKFTKAITMLKLILRRNLTNAQSNNSALGNNSQGQLMPAPSNTTANSALVAQQLPVTLQQPASITNGANISNPPLPSDFTMFPNPMNAQNMVNSLPQPQNPMNAALSNNFLGQLMPAPINTTANSALIAQPFPVTFQQQHALVTNSANMFPNQMNAQNMVNSLPQPQDPTNAALSNNSPGQLMPAPSSTTANSALVAQPFPVTFQQQHALVTNSANMFPNQMNAQNMVNSLPQPQDPTNAALSNSFPLQPMPAPDNTTANSTLVPQQAASNSISLADMLNSVHQQGPVNHDSQYAAVAGDVTSMP